MEEISTKNLDHLGIVAGLIDELGIVEYINEKLGQHQQEEISCGHVVKAMLLNSLGMVSAPLYLFSRFFEDKACEHLLGEGVRSEYLNDDKLGSVLDKLYAAGLTELFVEIAMLTVKQYNLETSSIHLDATTVSVHGDYEGSEEGAFKLKHGYSRDHRPDLKQFVIDLMVNKQGIPLYFRAGSGNEQDKDMFSGLIQDFQKQVNLDALFIADAALYSAKNLEELGSLGWLSRVPLTIAEAKTLVECLDEQTLAPFDTFEDYSFIELGNSYADIKQRWLVIQNNSLRKQQQAQVDQRITKAFVKAQKKLVRLAKRRFSCEEDARTAALAFESQLSSHLLDNIIIQEKKQYSQKGRPTDKTPYKISYTINATLIPNQALIDKQHNRCGRFILATNVLEHAPHCSSALQTTTATLDQSPISPYSADDLLFEYKGQHSVERGFRFFKDPLFFTSSVFLKTPERIAAISLIMALSLLVYSLGEHLLRQNLKTHHESVRHQSGQTTDSPTLRWIFQLFMGVHLLILNHELRISNLTPDRRHVLSFLPASCTKYYLLI